MRFLILIFEQNCDFFRWRTCAVVSALFVFIFRLFEGELFRHDEKRSSSSLLSSASGSQFWRFLRAFWAHFSVSYTFLMVIEETAVAEDKITHVNVVKERSDYIGGRWVPSDPSNTLLFSPTLLRLFARATMSITLCPPWLMTLHIRHRQPTKDGIVASNLPPFKPKANYRLAQQLKLPNWNREKNRIWILSISIMIRGLIQIVESISSFQKKATIDQRQG